VIWLKDGLPLEGHEDSTVNERHSGTLVNSTLTLSGLTMEDNGYYTCRAENSLAQIDLQQGYNLSVKDKVSGKNVMQLALPLQV
jgi:hypothetical protein